MKFHLNRKCRELMSPFNMYALEFSTEWHSFIYWHTEINSTNSGIIENGIYLTGLCIAFTFYRNAYCNCNCIFVYSIRSMESLHWSVWIGAYIHLTITTNLWLLFAFQTQLYCILFRCTSSFIQKKINTTPPLAVSLSAI